MNSLNILSARVIGQSPQPPRSRSVGGGNRSKDENAAPPRRSASQHTITSTQLERSELEDEVKQEGEESVDIKDEEERDVKDEPIDEKTPLLEKSSEAVHYRSSLVQGKSRPRLLVKKLADALVESIRWVLSKLIAPGVYTFNHFHNDEGHFSAFAPLHRMRRRPPPKNGSLSTTRAIGLSGSAERTDLDSSLSQRSVTRASSEKRSTSPATSDSEQDSSNEKGTGTQTSRNKKQSAQSNEEGAKRRSIRIKLNNEESAKRKREKKSQRTTHTKPLQEEAAAAELKSPTSPSSSLGITKYPHMPIPPRPLIPRRQPSYSSSDLKRPTSIAQKTLVIDLDETLIHSLAKGGRMSSGHMVEVKLSHPAAYNGLSLGPQHPILYYVHKRPNCDEFLRKVCKWYNLVAFTASVQEYADPVIDWLEQERKYFSARYYRQHCTFRNGAYIKDLSSVEPDLSKVMILDNSPLSYIFHEGTWLLPPPQTLPVSDSEIDNAIPIEGWINDPTDNDLLHIMPMLEGLQYVTDVRAFLSLRRGEVDAAQ